MSFTSTVWRGGLVTVMMILAVMVLGKATAGGFASRYTRHAYQKCAAKSSPEAGVIEVRTCNGLAGIPVIWTSDPDASSVDFGKVADGKDLGMEPFFEATEVVEWRGPMVGGALAPIATIVRYDTGPSVGKLNTSRLVIYRVAAGVASCVMGVVKGADANTAARALVDQHAASFVCGKSARVTKS